ncbi:hypothetical protein H6G81_24715 [Scytonema hofmannii FACHB-248]|uniref:Uncharacterized protein n=1 Tax=Scytonema hofmannii FACHB-248 TaxID=1842502 RepID=A0ABR8GX56_9CYAN|nr:MULTISPECIES: hypothetical protein [Nostocales]MBD2607640.1 hypothetical protein [Scytonema hofmannii FACHB-248]
MNATRLGITSLCNAIVTRYNAIAFPGMKNAIACQITDFVFIVNRDNYSIALIRSQIKFSNTL